jgi:signal transduction histidine kinase
LGIRTYLKSLLIINSDFRLKMMMILISIFILSAFAAFYFFLVSSDYTAHKDALQGLILPAFIFLLIPMIFLGIIYYSVSIALTEIRSSQKHIENLNASLTERIEEELKNSRRKDHLMIDQSRLAAMGELLVSLSHTWRQPLNNLAVILANVSDLYEYGELDDTKIRKLTLEADQVLQKLSSTIDDFRTFYSLKQEMTEFFVHDVLIESLTVSEPVLSVNNIKVNLDVLEGLSVKGIPGKFAQALLNILFNARDSLTENHTENPAVNIRLEQIDQEAVITMEDNGPGVSPAVLPKIFDPYFTTKKNSAGIGLYMAQMIINQMNGHIEAHNTHHGFRIIIRLPSADENRTG